MSGQNALPPVPEYIKTVISVIQAPTWAAARCIVDANPYLVDTLTDDMLSSLGQSARGNGVDPSATNVIEQHRRLFQRCLIVGVPDAFLEVAAIPKGHLRLADGTMLTLDDLL
jgi:hypothetical protein